MFNLIWVLNSQEWSFVGHLYFQSVLKYFFLLNFLPHSSMLCNYKYRGKKDKKYQLFFDPSFFTTNRQNWNKTISWHSTWPSPSINYFVKIDWFTKQELHLIDSTTGLFAYFWFNMMLYLWFFHFTVHGSIVECNHLTATSFALIFDNKYVVWLIKRIFPVEVSLNK